MYLLLIIFCILYIYAFRIASFPNNTLFLHPFSLEETLPLRGMLAISILLCHLCPHLQTEAPILYDLSYTIAVPCFFMLSGYGLSYSFWNKGPGYLDGFFKKRLLKLLWPLLIMSVIFQGWRYCNGIFETRSLLHNISPNSWFINALVIWYIGFYICFKWGKTNVKRTNLYIWIFTGFYIIITYKLGWKYYWMQILPMPIAITYVPYEEKFRNLMNKYPKMTLGISLFVSVVTLIYAILGNEGLPLPAWGTLMLNILPLLIVPLIYVYGGWQNKFIMLVGKLSYEFYIVHGFIVLLLADRSWYETSGIINAFITLSIVLTLTIVLSWLLKFISSKINNSVVTFKNK